MKHKKIRKDLIFFVKEKGRVIILLTLSFLYLINSTVWADTEETENTIQSSTAGQGLINLLNDLSTYLLILSPITGGLFALYFFIRKNGADEQDQKKWKDRLINTGFCVIGAVLVSGIINLLTGYFQ